MDDPTPPKLNWWQRLNAKPPGWDDPKAWIVRMIAAITIGLIVWWLRPHH